MAPVELELKVTVDRAGLKRLAASSVLKRLGRHSSVRQSLRSIYFDTADRRLQQADISLRMRAKAGVWIQTVKCGTHLRHGVSNPIELENVATSEAPDLSLVADAHVRKRLLDIVAGDQLEPLFTTDVSRTTRQIEIPHDGTIEIALDSGSIHCAGQRVPISEVELELKAGQPHALLTAAEALFANRSVTFSRRSKAALGYDLLSGGSDKQQLSGASSAANKPILRRTMTRPQALTEIGRATCTQILLNWDAVLLNDDPEGAHQLRVGLRKLRTALKAFKPITRDAEFARLATEARDLGRIVGALRDCDVLISEILDPVCAELAPTDAAGTVRNALIRHCSRQREIVRHELHSSRWTRFKLNCALVECAVARSVARSGTKHHKGDVQTAAYRALKSAWRQVRKRGRNIDHLTIAERHEMRKALKRLRYTTEHFSSLYPRRETRPFLQRLKDLQDVFGYLNDVAMSEALPGIVTQYCGSHDRLPSIMHTVREWHQAQADMAWKQARERWSDLSHTSRFWR